MSLSWLDMSMTIASYTRRRSDSTLSTSRGVSISAISMRGGASRMSIPDGSRHRTSDRSDSAMRSVGRSRIDGASTGTLSNDRRSPNCRLPSMRTVRWFSWPRATARLNATVVLPTPPFGANTLMTRFEVTASCSSNSLRALPILVMRSKPENGIDSTPWMPRMGSTSTGFWGTVRTITGTPNSASWIISTSFGPLMRPWSSASTRTMSGRSSLIVGMARAPSLRTSSSFTRAWALSRPRMYWATCGTSSTMSSRV